MFRIADPVAPRVHPRLMGIVQQDALQLARLAKRGVSFRQTLTLGRQNLYFQPERISAALIEMGYESSVVAKFVDRSKDGGSADFLFELIGAREVDAMDISDYEGAKIRHDLNQSVGKDLEKRFDVVFDGGTLEHVFQFPTAIRNAMEMVKIGGSLLLLTPTNNLSGHGFYQFSPELFYNILSSENGFEVQQMLAHEYSPLQNVFEVADPKRVRTRVTLSNSWPVMLFVHAKRTQDVSLFQKTPQQSDYEALWKETPRSGAFPVDSSLKPQPKWKRSVKDALIKVAPKVVYTAATLGRLLGSSEQDFKNPKFFRKLD